MLNSTSEDISREAWLAAAWRQEWQSAGPSCIHRHIWDPGSGAIGDKLPRRQWTSMRKWGLADSVACECGDPEQTADHVITTCPLYRTPSEAGLFDLGPEMLAWLQDTELDL